MVDDDAEIDRLVILAQAGDREAFRQLVLGLQREVFAYLCAQAPNPMLAEEVLQTTFVTAWEKLDNYRPRGLFVGWLKTVARNQLRQELRRLRRQVGMDPDVLDRVLLEDAQEEVERDDRALSALTHCLDQLPPMARELVERRYYRNASVERLASELGRKASNLAVTLFRLRKSLRQCIERQGVRA